MEFTSVKTRDKKLQKMIALFDAEDGLQEASKHIADDILRCDAAGESFTSFKLFDSKSVQAEALVKALMTARTTTGSLAVDISSVIDKVTKAMGEPEMAATMGSCRRVLGNLTGLQSMLRDFRPGESREGLAKKCHKGISRRKYWSLDPKMSLMLQSLASAQPAKAEPAKGSAPSARDSAVAQAAEAEQAEPAKGSAPSTRDSAVAQAAEAEPGPEASGQLARNSAML